VLAGQKVWRLRAVPACGFVAQLLERDRTHLLTRSGRCGKHIPVKGAGPRCQMCPKEEKQRKGAWPNVTSREVKNAEGAIGVVGGGPINLFLFDFSNSNGLTPVAALRANR